MPIYLFKLVKQFINCSLFITVFSIPLFAQEQIDTIPEWKVKGYLSALHDLDSDVQMYVLQKIKNQKLWGKECEPIAKQVANFLTNDDKYLKISAIDALGNMGEVGAVYASQVADLLKDSDADVRRFAVNALGNMGEEVGAVYASQVAGLLKDSGRYVRRSAARALGNMGEVGAVYASQVADLLKDSAADVRGSAARALGNMGEEVGAVYASQVADLLKDSEPYVRRSAARALGNMGEVGAVYASQIVYLLKDNGTFVRATATDVLRKMGEKVIECASQVADLLKDSDADVRSSAADVLGNMGEEVGAVYASQVANLLKDSDRYVRSSAADVLGNMGEEVGAVYASQVAGLLKDSDRYVRGSAARALGNMGEVGAVYASQVADLLKDSDADVRGSAARALGNMGEIGVQHISGVINLLKDYKVGVEKSAVIALENWNIQLDISIILATLNFIENDSGIDLKIVAHILSGGQPFIHWLGRPDKLPKKQLTRTEATEILNTFSLIWAKKDTFSNLIPDVERATSEIIARREVAWTTEDLTLLKEHATYLENTVYQEAINKVIEGLETESWFERVGYIFLTHVGFWIILIFLYPKSPSIQALFFWNKWVRNFVGLGYVGVLLKYIPFLRKILLSPFKVSFLADAQLNNFDESNYFTGFQLKNKQTNQLLTQHEFSGQLKGQVVVEGASGLGKSMLLRNAIKGTSRTAVFLPATKCSGGIIPAIQSKVFGYAQESDFLKSLIYIGGIDIYIDGLNEVSVDTRAKVTEFCERYSNCSVLISTQPMEWRMPSTSKVYTIQALKKDQIAAFLAARVNVLMKDAVVTGDEFKTASKEYLDKTINEQVTDDQKKSIMAILSNPMDLTLVADMLSRKKNPNLFNLQKQQYGLMSEEFKRKYIRAFDLKKFANTAYEMRLNDKEEIPQKEYQEELICMERFKMVLLRTSKNNEGKEVKDYYFRHDKIMDFFIVQKFLEEGKDLPPFQDVRFSGVFYLLAILLPLEEAKKLREQLIDYAADSSDNYLSNKIVQVMRARINKL